MTNKNKEERPLISVLIPAYNIKEYLPTCLAVLILRKKNPGEPSTLEIPFGPVIPTVAIVVSVWLLIQADLHKILIGLGGLVIAVPFYFLMKEQYLEGK